MIGFIGIGILENAVLDRVIPAERVGKRMAGDLHVRQREHPAGDVFHFRRQFRIESMRGDLGFDDRHRVRNAIALKDVFQQDPRCQWRPRKFGTRREAVPVNVRGQEPPAIFGRDVRHRDDRQAQRGGEEREGVEVPA